MIRTIYIGLGKVLVLFYVYRMLELSKIVMPQSGTRFVSPP